jgi:hypothetical protein
MRIGLIFTWTIAGAIMSSASAQSYYQISGAAAQEIATDRPAVTDSSAVVPKGALQIENGFLDTGGQPFRTLDFPEALFRVGVGATTEVRFAAPDYFRDDLTPVGPRSGFGDLSVGVKQQLGAPRRFQLAAVLSLSVPMGANAISSHGYDPSVQLPWSRKLSPDWSVAGMLSVYARTQNGSHSVTGESTFLVDRQITKACDAFVEYAGDFPDSGGPRHLLHFGTAYKIHSRQQIDLHAGAGLSAAAVDHFVGVGYSVRFQLVRR